MNPKITKLKAERAKNDEKIAALRSRNRELDESIVELENTDIIGLARATGMSMEELAQFLTQLKGAARPLSHPIPRRIRTMCMKKNNNRLLRGVAAVLCLALMFLTMSGMAMATDMEDARQAARRKARRRSWRPSFPSHPKEHRSPLRLSKGRTHRNRLPRRLKRRKRRSRRRNMRWTQIFRQAGTTRR